MPEPAATPAAAPVVIRDAGPQDEHFILKTALLTLRNSSHLSWHVANEDFFAGEQLIVKRLLARSRVLVAHPPDDPELIAGVLVYEPEPETLHFVYVRAALRRQGVGAALLAASGLDVQKGFVATAATYDLTKGWMGRKYPLVRYNPYPRWE